MNIEQLNKLARTDFSNFIQSENNVKYKIVIPFLQSFNHVDLDLEHAAQGSRIDINIGNRIIVETKALGINLDMHVQQLSNYSGKELPVLSILTNGRQFRIYSPQWRKQISFSEKVIYDFELGDLNDVELINRLEKILDFSNYESEEYIDNLAEREREIINARKEIDQIKKVKSEQAIGLNNEINKLNEQIQELHQQIKIREKTVADINADKIPEIEDKIKEYYLPVKRNAQQKAQLPVQPQDVKSNASVAIGDKLKIVNRDGVLAFGQKLPDESFIVFAGSIISKTVADHFPRLQKAFELRRQYESEGTINVNRIFTKDIIFNSSSLAATVILGCSSNGNKEWRSKE